MVADIVENPTDNAILRGLLYQIQPQTLVIKSKQDDQRMAAIRKLVGLTADGPNEAHNARNESDNDPDGDFDHHYDRDDGNAQPNGENQMEGTACHLHCVPASFYNLEAGKKELITICGIIVCFFFIN